MPERLTSKEFRALTRKGKVSIDLPSYPSSTTGRGDGPVKHHATVQEQLQTMGEFFELPPTKVNFYIRQMELAGKL